MSQKPLGMRTTDEPLFQLPCLLEGWAWSTVGELAEAGEQPVLTGPFGSTLGRDDFVATGVPLLTIGCLTEKGVNLDKAFYISPDKASQLARYRVRNGDLLFSRSASVGRAGLVTEALEGSVINYHLMRLRLNPLLINSRFFIYFVRGSSVVSDYLRSVNHGATRDGINTNNLLQMPVALPPLNCQARIVAKIEELLSDLDAGVSSLERAKTNLKRYRAAILRAAVTGELTADWRAAHPNVEPATKLLDRILVERQRKFAAERASLQNRQRKCLAPATPKPAELPGSWCWATVEQLGAVQLGRQRSPKNRSDKHPTTYIRAANITEDGLALHDLLDMEFTPAEQETYRLHSGDIILSEASGSPDQVGKPAVWNDEVPNCCFQNTVIRLRPETVSSRYFLVVFRHFYFNKMFARVAAGVGINHLSAAKFAALSVPLPPLLEQDIIVSEVEQRLSVIKATENYIAASLKRASRLRQSILKEAFAGRLVPQDPKDESATVLLDRIRTSSALVNGKAKPRTRGSRQRELFE